MVSLRNISYLTKLNIHITLHWFAFMMVQIFGPVYMYKIGIPIYIIFLYWFGYFVLRFSLRFLLIKACMRFGSRPIFIFGIFILAFQYLIYLKIEGIDLWLLILLLVESFSNTIYWTLYHSYFAEVGSNERRGRQVALRESLTLLVTVLSPISSALLIEHLSYYSVFYVASSIALFSTLFVQDIPNLKLEKMSFRTALAKTDLLGMRYYFVNGIHVWGHFFAWRLVLFVVLGDYVYFGGLLSLAMLLKAIGLFVVGKMFDLGKGASFAYTGLCMFFISILGRTFLELDIPTIICLDILFMLGDLFFTPIFFSANYTASKASKDPLWFQFFAEAGFDVGGSLVSLGIALAVFWGMEFRLTLLFSILGIFGLCYVVGRYSGGKAKG